MKGKDNGNSRHCGSPVLPDIDALDQLSEDVPFLNDQRKTLSQDRDDRRLLTWDEIEPWQQDNHFIIRGYRRKTNSYLKSISSLTYIHNQTVNIYSHLLGAIAFMITNYILYQAIAPRYSSATWTDLVVFGSFFVGLFLCLFCSACFHTFGNHSDVIYHYGLLMDLVGIVCLITGSFFPGVYYGFYCEPGPRNTYWAMITIFGAGAVLFCLIPELRKPSWRPQRTAMFLAMGLSGVLPMTHAALEFGIAQARRQMGWAWYIGEGIFYVAGSAIYAAKVPERFNPGRFDIWGSSHQIFHVLVLIGAASHLTGVIKGFDYNHNPDTARC